jgi:aspartate aminotransferase-like enzyme
VSHLTSLKIDAAVYADAERRLARLIGTSRDLLLLQGEAILVLEATARGLGGPGVRALNLVSGPYGKVIGDWLSVGGADVSQLEVAFDSAIDPETVRTALADGHFDVVSVVHAEAATGVVNPLAEIARAAHEAGALILVDAVASVGAEPLEIDELELELVMIGPQKGPGGPSGVCALIASERGWAQIEANPAAPRESIISLLDWKQRWIDAGRQRIPGYAHEYEMRALLEMLDRHQSDDGLVRVIERHARARDGTLAGARALGLKPWVRDAAQAAGVATLLRAPQEITVDALTRAAIAHLDELDAGLLGPAPGPLAGHALRINHTGEAARPEPVIAAISALGAGLRELGLDPDIDAAVAAASRALWRE